MELFIFGRFHARTGCETDLEDAIHAVAEPTRAEPECISFEAFRSTGNPRLFYIHSRWVNEAAFDLHATLPHTTHFIERAASLIDHPLDVTRTTRVS